MSDRKSSYNSCGFYYMNMEPIISIFRLINGQTSDSWTQTFNTYNTKAANHWAESVASSIHLPSSPSISLRFMLPSQILLDQTTSRSAHNSVCTFVWHGTLR